MCLRGEIFLLGGLLSFVEPVLVVLRLLPISGGTSFDFSIFIVLCSDMNLSSSYWCRAHFCLFLRTSHFCLVVLSRCSFLWEPSFARSDDLYLAFSHLSEFLLPPSADLCVHMVVLTNAFIMGEIANTRLTCPLWFGLMISDYQYG
jgi:hypothetical protein